MALQLLRRVSVVAIVVAIHSAPASGQRPGHIPSAHEVGELVRKSGIGGPAIAMLTRGDGGLTLPERDAIADTLVSIAISHPGNDTGAHRVRRLALRTLARAALNRGSGGPYPGGGARLLRIVQHAPEVWARAYALSAISLLADEQEAREILRLVAVSDNEVASDAIGHLVDRVGPEGLAILKELHRTGAVTEPRARAALAGLAYHSRWPAPASDSSTSPAAPRPR